MSNEPPSSIPPPPGTGDIPPPPSYSGPAAGGYPSAPPPPAGYQPAYGGAPSGQVPPNLGGVFYNKGLNILLAIVTCGVWSAVWSWKAHGDLKRYNGDGLGEVAGLLLGLFVSPVVMFTVPNEIQKMYERDGRQSPVTTLWGLWFLLPLIGNIIWYLKVQDALNDFWLSKGSAPA